MELSKLGHGLFAVNESAFFEIEERVIETFDRDQGIPETRTERWITSVRSEIDPSKLDGVHLNLGWQKGTCAALFRDLAKIRGANPIVQLTINLNSLEGFKGVDALFASPSWAGLKALILMHDRAGVVEFPKISALFHALNKSPIRLAALLCLNVEWDDSGCESIHRISALQSLELLDLTYPRFSNAGIRNLFAQASPIRLKHLDIASSPIAAEMRDFIASSPTASGAQCSVTA